MLNLAITQQERANIEAAVRTELERFGLSDRADEVLQQVAELMPPDAWSVNVSIRGGADGQLMVSVTSR